MIEMGRLASKAGLCHLEKLLVTVSISAVTMDSASNPAKQ
jgi:hypothetical protein